MSIVEVNKLDDTDLFPIAKGEEPQSKHFGAIRERMWVVDHPYAGGIDTTIEYGKWVGDATHFEYVEYDIHNWHWLETADYHPGVPIVKYRWGLGADQVDIFIFKGTGKGVVLNANPPVVGGQINGLWMLGTDPNKYAHWNKNAGRPDIQAEHRWRFEHHGWTEEDGWEYGMWEAWKEYPIHTDPYEQIPHLKHSGVTRARHHPVEKDKDDITQKLWTMWQRKYKDSYIGDIPNETYWYHYFKTQILSEYVRADSEPTDSNQIGENLDWRDPKFNPSYQTRIQHWIERNYGYVTEVDDFWKKNWQYWCHYGIEINQTKWITGCPNTHPNYVNGRGAFAEYGPPYYISYYTGNSVWHDGWFWRCIQDTGAQTVEPGVHVNWEDYWVKDTLHQPNFIVTDPLYIQFSDYLHCCNSSAFEKVLKDIGEYDWYWDPNTTVPWYMYQNHYYELTHHIGNPEGPGLWNAHHQFPLPRGCWRRIWRYTQSWDTRRNPDTGEYLRTQLSRFGKEININGNMVSMMWPGDLGNPPGYDEEILKYYGYIGGTHFNFWWYKHVIDQATYDVMDQPVGEEWKYNQYYCVVDVEDLFRQAYLARSGVESRIAERHDPTTTQWATELNPYTKFTEDVEEPIFELYADMVNDMRDAVAQLKYLSSSRTKEVEQLFWYTNKNQLTSAVAAYTAGKNSELYVEYSQTQFHVGLRGFVCYYPEAHIQYGPWDVTLPGDHMDRSGARVTIISDNQDFPHSLAGTAMIKVKYRTFGVEDLINVVEDCTIGFGGVVLEDPRVPDEPTPLTWRIAFIGLEAKDFVWVYNVGESKWEYKWKSEVALLEGWPPDAYFEGIYTDDERRIWERSMELDFDIGNDLIFKLDFAGYDPSVIAEDVTNFIEV